MSLSGGGRVEDDDRWRDKIDLLLEEPPPVASSTFGIPDRGVVERLRRAGVTVLQTVTSPNETATEVGVDGLVVRAQAAGGHSGTLTPGRLVPRIPLPELAAVRAAAGAPVLAAGGIAGPDDAAEAVRTPASA